MKKRLLSLLLVLPVILSACKKEAAHSQEPPKATVLAIAVEENCPKTALRAMEDFCDEIERLSENRIEVRLQHWENPLESGAGVLFVTAGRLAESLPIFAALQADFTFSSYAQMNDSLNAQTVLKELSAPLRGRYGYEVHSTFYCGRQYLVGQRNDLTGAARGDDSDAIRWAVRDVREGTIAIEPLTIGASYPKDVLCYADTEKLVNLLPQEGEELVLCDFGYRYQLGMLCPREGLRQELGERDYAVLLEAAAIARPSCEEDYRALDEQIAGAFSSVVGPSSRLRRQVREEQSSGASFQQWQHLYQLIEEYGR